MVSNKTIKDYNFEVIEDYFNYIEKSIINGQRAQAENLIKKLSKEQKKQALNWFDENLSLYNTDSAKEAITTIIEVL